MKKGLVKFLVLTFVLTTMSVSGAFAASIQAGTYQKQQLELIRQQNEALKQQNEYLKQQTEALKQNQAPMSGQAVQTYAPAPVYAPSPAVYYAPAPVYYSRPSYAPGPWYGGLAAGYILGNWGRCGRGWGHGYRHCWH